MVDKNDMTRDVIIQPTFSNERILTVCAATTLLKD